MDARLTRFLVASLVALTASQLAAQSGQTEQAGRVLQFFEYDHVWRTIYTDGRKLPTGVDPRWYGYAVGHWEGDTLVIESAGFDDRTWLDADGHPHSDQMRLLERYRRTGP